MTRALAIGAILAVATGAPASANPLGFGDDARGDDLVGVGADRRADEPPTARRDDDPLAPRRPTVGQLVADGFTELGDELGAHLGALSAGALSLRVDGRARRLQLGVDLDGDDVGLGLRSDVRWRGGAAHVDTRLDLRLDERHLRLELPEIQLVPRSYDDEQYVEVRLPVLMGTF